MSLDESTEIDAGYVEEAGPPVEPEGPVLLSVVL